MRKSLFVGSLAVCAVMLFSSSIVLAADSWMGSWKLNATKSKFSPGPAPKSLMLKLEATPEGTKLAADGVSTDGKPNHSGWVSKFDGKEVPYPGNPDADMAAPKKIDANSYENVWKKGGKVTITAKVSVSKDGKSLTVVQTGTNAKGEAVNSTLMFDKQ